MKKNITINLFGSLYAIDEDAYGLLEKYLDNTKRYFSKRDGGEEIADDIEHRVAELFEELRVNGVEAINIEHVQDIIKRIGNPEDMDEDTGAENVLNEDSFETESKPSDSNSKYFNGRKLYRNPDSQIVGGVLSGLCTYFGGNDPLPWRLIFCILALFTKIIPFLIIYMILWAVIPMAITSEDKLKMKGKPVNMNTLNEEIMTDPSDIEQGKIMSIFNTIITIIGFCLKLFFGFLICACILGLLITVFGLLLGYITPFSILGFSMVSENVAAEFIADNPSLMLFIWISLLSAILFLTILLYSIIHSIIKKNSGDKMSKFTRITMILTTVVSLCASIGFGMAASKKIDQIMDKIEREENTLNGVYLQENQHKMLAENGWDIMSYENASERLYRRVRSFYDDGAVYFFSFRRNDTASPMNINLRRQENFPKGNYHIEAVASAKCNGAYIYAKNDSTTMSSVMIPVDDSRNKGNMQAMTNDELRKTVFFNIDETDELWYDDDFYETISYWSFVRSETFHHEGGPISYGITNIGSVVNREDSSVPAWKFSLREIKIVRDKN